VDLAIFNWRILLTGLVIFDTPYFQVYVITFFLYHWFSAREVKISFVSLKIWLERTKLNPKLWFKTIPMQSMAQ
jgi:hypothetical protein